MPPYSAPNEKSISHHQVAIIAAVVLNISDGGNWIGPFAATVHGQDTPQSKTLAAELESLLWEGKANELVNRMKQHETALSDERPKPTFRRELGYFEKHQEHMHYDLYRCKGWPIGSGNKEAGVKTFNKRVKGTEHRSRLPGAEAVVVLRAAWKSQDGRWERLGANRPAYVLATATKKAA